MVEGTGNILKRPRTDSTRVRLSMRLKQQPEGKYICADPSTLLSVADSRVLLRCASLAAAAELVTQIVCAGPPLPKLLGGNRVNNAAAALPAKRCRDHPQCSAQHGVWWPEQLAPGDGTTGQRQDDGTHPCRTRPRCSTHMIARLSAP